MAFLTTPIDGLLIFEPHTFDDSRGYFFEAYNTKTFAQAGITAQFVQDNQVLSTLGVLRGMHFQAGEAAQAKLVRVIEGEVYDIAVDLRPDSPTFGQSYGLYLSGKNKRQLYIPRGFAHGYLVTSPTAIVTYKCDNFYYPQSEVGIRYDDPALSIDWPTLPGGYVIAERDQVWGPFDLQSVSGRSTAPASAPSPTP